MPCRLFADFFVSSHCKERGRANHVGSSADVSLNISLHHSRVNLSQRGILYTPGSAKWKKLTGR